MKNISKEAYNKAIKNNHTEELQEVGVRGLNMHIGLL